jgi:hypothetical protein
MSWRRQLARYSTVHIARALNTTGLINTLKDAGFGKSDQVDLTEFVARSALFLIVILKNYSNDLSSSLIMGTLTFFSIH